MIRVEGYIKLFRCLLDKPIWKCSTPEQKTILITLLLKANHSEAEWEWQGQKFKVKPGQFVTSLDSIVKACGKGITIQNVRSALRRFEKLGFLTNQSTKIGRLITIENWYIYQKCNNQPNKDYNKEVTMDQQRANKELTPNKNDKNDKKKYTDEFELFWKEYPNKKGKSQTYKHWNKLLKQYSPDQLILAAKRYAKDCENTEKKFIKVGYNFLGDCIYEDYISERGFAPKQEYKRKVRR